METEKLGPYDYDALQACPFCGVTNLLCEGDNCAHFVVAFQTGEWARDLCPPVSCNGFQFNREHLEKALDESPGVHRWKPSTSHHPAIDAYYIDDQALAEGLRSRYRKTRVRMEPCGTDGAVYGLRDEGGEIVCEICGDPGQKWVAPRHVM